MFTWIKVYRDLSVYIDLALCKDLVISQILDGHPYLYVFLDLDVYRNRAACMDLDIYADLVVYIALDVYTDLFVYTALDVYIDLDVYMGRSTAVVDVCFRISKNNTARLEYTKMAATTSRSGCRCFSRQNNTALDDIFTPKSFAKSIDRRHVFLPTCHSRLLYVTSAIDPNRERPTTVGRSRDEPMGADNRRPDARSADVRRTVLNGAETCRTRCADEQNYSAKASGK